MHWDTCIGIRALGYVHWDMCIGALAMQAHHASLCGSYKGRGGGVITIPTVTVKSEERGGGEP
jgi:hypothetical protein